VSLRLIAVFTFSIVMGLLCGVVIGGVMGEPWWYVFPISLAGGIGIGIAGGRRK
jgi:hypothetical protein